MGTSWQSTRRAEGWVLLSLWCSLGWNANRLESMAAEVSALHEAMAGLHGEMGAVQRELDGAKASQDKLTAGGAEAVHVK